MLPTIIKECSQFLAESNGYPLLKNLPVDNHGFRKVKVRKKKKQHDDLIEAFNKTFNYHSDLMERSIFAHGLKSFYPVVNSDVEPFYIFPIDGYKFLFAENVANTTETYKTTLTTLIDNYGETGVKTFSEILKYQYTFDNLEHGLSTDSEIILYNIPYYYAIRYSLVENYENFITLT